MKPKRDRRSLLARAAGAGRPVLVAAAQDPRLAFTFEEFCDRLDALVQDQRGDQ